VTLTVLSNDTDLDLRDRLSISAINGTAVTTGAPLALASGALAITNSDGTLRYDPASAFSHLARGQTATDTFSYTAADGHGGASTATVLVTVNGRNDAPVAGADAFTTDASTRLTVAASTLLRTIRTPTPGTRAVGATASRPGRPTTTPSPTESRTAMAAPMMRR
jgi:VCBS repeat-containing protein